MLQHITYNLTGINQVLDECNTLWGEPSRAATVTVYICYTNGIGVNM